MRNAKMCCFFHIKRLEARQEDLMPQNHMPGCHAFTTKTVKRVAQRMIKVWALSREKFAVCNKFLLTSPQILECSSSGVKIYTLEKVWKEGSLSIPESKKNRFCSMLLFFCQVFVIFSCDSWMEISIYFFPLFQCWKMPAGSANLFVSRLKLKNDTENWNITLMFSLCFFCRALGFDCCRDYGLCLLW